MLRKDICGMSAAVIRTLDLSDGRNIAVTFVPGCHCVGSVRRSMRDFSIGGRERQKKGVYIRAAVNEN